MSTRLVLIVGTLRSGSTLVEQLLGAATGLAPVGESLNVYRYARLGLPCSCGEPVDSCPVWEPLLARHVTSPAHLAELEAFGREQLLLSSVKGRPQQVAGSAHFGTHLALLRDYASALGTAGVIESSKIPSFAAALRHLVPADDLGLVHLVRDPRAVALSESTPTPSAVPGMEPPMRSPGMSGFVWQAINAWTLALSTTTLRGVPSTRLRYEELVTDPESVITRIAAATKSPVVNGWWEHRSDASGFHSIAGNPSRQKSQITVRTQVATMAPADDSATRVTRLTSFPTRLVLGY